MLTSADARSAPMVDAVGSSNANGNRTTGRWWGNSTNTDVDANDTETTALLDGVSGTRVNDGVPALTKDSWAGFEDFEGLPWWRRPSVCHPSMAGDAVCGVWVGDTASLCKVSLLSDVCLSDRSSWD